MKKIVLPVMFQPYEDEMLGSWIRRLAEANGLKIRMLLSRFFGEDVVDIGHLTDYTVYYMQGLFWKERSIEMFPKADVLLLKHTPLLFLSGETIRVAEAASAVQAILYNCGDDAYDVDLRDDHKTHTRRFCPDCVKEDTKSGKDFYLKTWHQLPEVRICAKHGTPLAEFKSQRGKADFSGKQYTDITDEDRCLSLKAYKEYLNNMEFKPVTANPVGSIVPKSKRGMFIYAECLECGTEFLTTIYACARGRGCPICDRKADVIERQLKMLPSFRQVKKITSLSQTSSLMHSCGEIYEGQVMDIIWKGLSCPCTRDYRNED